MEKLDKFKIKKDDFTIYFDGAVHPTNPGGHIGYGFYIEDSEGENILNGSFYEEEHEHNTNNYAEHMAALTAIETLTEFLKDNPKAKKFTISIKGDSMLVIKQLLGRWAIKQGYYVGAATAAKKAAKELRKIVKKISYEWIPREQNEKADEYSTNELYNRGIYRK